MSLGFLALKPAAFNKAAGFLLPEYETQPAKIVSGKPRMPGVRMANSEPDCGADASASTFKRTDALVT